MFMIILDYFTVCYGLFGVVANNDVCVALAV